jgi:hypothetical protein
MIGKAAFFLALAAYGPHRELRVELPDHTSAVRKVMGEPDLWGHALTSFEGRYCVDVTWMSHALPQDVPGKMEWVYIPKGPDGRDLLFDGPVTIVFFDEKRLTGIVHAELDSIYDP